MSRTGSTLNISAGIRRALLVVLALVIALILFLPRQTQTFLEGLGSPVAQLMTVPIQWLATWDRSIRESWNHYLALQGVHEQNLALRQEIQELEGEISQLREQATVSEQLTQLLEFQEEAPLDTVAAQVIGRNATNWYRALILNKGEDQGIRKNMGVIAQAGVVGRVVKTTPFTSIVLLLTDPNAAVTGMIQRTRDEGIVQGTTQGYVRMKYIPPLSPIQIDDIVATSGLTGDFPRGLPIGRIRQIEKADADLFQSAEVQPIIDFSKLEGVLVIISTKQSANLASNSDES